MVGSRHSFCSNATMGGRVPLRGRGPVARPSRRRLSTLGFGGRLMSLTTLRLREAWNWGGLSFKELALRTYRAMDQHETIDRAAIVAFYAMLALVPFLGLVLTIALGASDRVAGQIEKLARTSLPSEDASRIDHVQIAKIQAD